MFLQFFCAVFILLAQNGVSASLQPLASVDDANSFLKTLSDSVTGYISVANLQLWNLMFEVTTLRNNADLQGQISLTELDQRYQTIYTEIIENHIGNRYNISECINTIHLQGLADGFRSQLEFCLDSAKAVADIIQSDAEYRVDVYKTNILALQFQLDLCKADETCLTAFMERAQNQTIELPLRVQDETSKTTEDIKVHETAVSRCLTTCLRGYTTSATQTLSLLSNCVFGSS